MRRITFRAMSIDDCCMVHSMTIMNGTTKRKRDNLYLLVHGESIECDQKTLGQYSERKDVSGNFICQDDLVSCEASPTDGTPKKIFIGKVVLRDFGFSIVLWHKGCWHAYGSMNFINMKIIGNIYENPELLEAPND